jgi:hypothetical protein
MILNIDGLIYVIDKQHILKYYDDYNYFVFRRFSNCLRIKLKSKNI